MDTSPSIAQVSWVVSGQQHSMPVGSVNNSGKEYHPHLTVRLCSITQWLQESGRRNSRRRQRCGFWCQQRYLFSPGAKEKAEFWRSTVPKVEEVESWTGNPLTPKLNSVLFSLEPGSPLVSHQSWMLSETIRSFLWRYPSLARVPDAINLHFWVIYP